MLELLLELRTYIKQRKISLTLKSNGIRCVQPNERVFSAATEIEPLRNSRKWIKPHIFTPYNQVFQFIIRFQYFYACRATNDIQNELNDIIETVNCGEKSVYFKWVEEISASKSDRPENYFKWDSFYQFGKYAYEEHLKYYRDLETKEDWDKHYNELCDLFEDFCNGRGGIRSFIYQKWCGRYYIDNTGVSRRAAAIAYMAKKGKPEFDRPIVYPLTEETINWEPIRRIESIADSYIVVASEKFHREMELLIEQTNVPLGICTTCWNREKNQDKDVRLYLLLHDQYLYNSLNTWQEKKWSYQSYYDAYVYQRRVLKPQLDHMKTMGLAVSLSQYINFVTKVWREDVLKKRSEIDFVG